MNKMINEITKGVKSNETVRDQWITGSSRKRKSVE